MATRSSYTNAHIQAKTNTHTCIRIHIHNIHTPVNQGTNAREYSVLHICNQQVGLLIFYNHGRVLAAVVSLTCVLYANFLSIF